MRAARRCDPITRLMLCLLGLLSVPLLLGLALGWLLWGR